MNMKDSHIVITGAAGSIGVGLLNYLLPKVKQISAIDINTKHLQENLGHHSQLKTYECDLTDYVAVENLVSAIYKQEQVDVLFNNAGKIHSEPLVNLISTTGHHHDPNNWHQVISSNLTTTFFMGSLVAEQMMIRRHKGVIINMSSVSASGNMGQSAYAAAKAGIEALTVSWSKELALFGIRVAAIAPGFFDTCSTQSALSNATLQKTIRSIPLNRLGQIEELGHALQFIIENNYYTGRILELDGGLRC